MLNKLCTKIACESFIFQKRLLQLLKTLSSFNKISYKMHFTTKCRAGTLRETLVAFSFTQISAHSIFAPFSSTISRKNWNPVFKQTQGAIFFYDI